MPLRLCASAFQFLFPVLLLASAEDHPQTPPPGETEFRGGGIAKRSLATGGNQVDRADSKGFVMLTFDTTPDDTDTTPFPDTATRWKYRAIYRVGEPTGRHVER